MQAESCNLMEMTRAFVYRSLSYYLNPLWTQKQLFIFINHNKFQVFRKCISISTCKEIRVMSPPSPQLINWGLFLLIEVWLFQFINQNKSQNYRKCIDCWNKIIDKNLTLSVLSWELALWTNLIKNLVDNQKINYKIYVMCMEFCQSILIIDAISEKLAYFIINDT